MNRRMWIASVLASLGSGRFLVGADDDAKLVRALDLKPEGQELARGDVKKPKVLAGSKEVEAAFPKGFLAEKINAQVDFKKEKVLYFAWSGSGMDNLDAPIVDTKKRKVQFPYQRGRTKDLRSHYRLFVILNDVEWEVVDKK